MSEQVGPEERNNCNGVCEICPDRYDCPDSPEYDPDPDPFEGSDLEQWDYP
jgi:hypothetical protein